MSDKDLLSDNEGVSIGSPFSYINKFKKMEKSGLVDREDAEPAEQVLAEKPVSSAVSYSSIPAEYNDETEKEILVHYYRKFGNQSCDDFDKIGGKIAASINRLFSKNFTPADMSKRLAANVSAEDVAFTQSVEKDVKRIVKESSSTGKNAPVRLNISPGKYDYIEGLDPLSEKEKDLCQFIDKENLCFSSDGYTLYLSVKPDKKKCFDNLFRFNDREKIIYEMFKEQLGDEHKAKKLVLMSRKLNSKPKKKSPKKHSSLKEESFKTEG